jgi:galactose mutarotase-like enzyme
VRLVSGDAVVEVDAEDGGRITRLAVLDVELLTPAGCFVMAPWAGRTRDGRFTHEGVEHRLPVEPKHAPDAIHGTVRRRPWVVERADPRQVHLSTELGPDWPWPGWCEHRIRLEDDRVELELSLHAPAGGDPYPATMGWHPWFAKPAAVDLLAVEMLERGDDHLPTGRRVRPPLPVGTRPLDDCFEEIGWPVQLRWRNGLRLDVTATGWWCSTSGRTRRASNRRPVRPTAWSPASTPS